MLVAFGGYTVPLLEVLIIMAPIIFVVYTLFLRQHRGTPTWAIMIFKGQTTGFLFASKVTENLDLQTLTIKIRKGEELEFDTSKAPPLEIRVNAYKWIRLFFVSEETKQSLDYRTMVSEAKTEQNLAGDVAMRLLSRTKTYIEAIMVQSKDDIKYHIPWILAGAGATAILFMLMQFLFV